LLNVSGVYIGILESIKNPITDADNEEAHVNPAAAEIVRYIAADPTSRFMIGKSLTEA
jgi:hypothetical protein